MKKWLIILALAIVAPAAAQFINRPNVAPQTLVGNPLSITSSAQAIQFTSLNNYLLAGNFINPKIPAHVDLNHLPPQTIIGNGTGTAGELQVITFAQLVALQSRIGGLPTQQYNIYDPANIPPFTAVGNLSSVKPALVLPISLAQVFGALVPCTNNMVLVFTNSCALIMQPFS